ncbi:MAG: hypothetical protein GX318_03885 [Clostridia bacterium]|nr:hypothetical protein [Clostridia bacterium]
MIERLYQFQKTQERLIERIIDDENVNLNHLVLPKGGALPEHYSDSNVYMIVIRGQITLKLNDQEEHSYSSGSIVNIPYDTKMNIFNQHDEVLEFFVVKSPSPKNYQNVGESGD